MKNDKKKILVAPLNWGLGHAVRDIPLIKTLLKNNYEVILAGEGASGELLKKEFPKLQYVYIPSFSISYPKNNFFILKLLMQIFKIIKGIKKEYKQLQNIIKDYQVDIVISDNRYGLYSDKISCVFITHQIYPVLLKSLKIFEKFIYQIHQKKINKFTQCLIPDFEGNTNISGSLSHKLRLPEKFNFIGILSQFEFKEKKPENYKYDMAVILSGPEPQRSIFENIMSEKILQTGKNAIIITGQPNLSYKNKNNKLTIVSHLSRKEMQKVIINSEIIISRSGYTTIMDLVKLHKKAILIPTPGQTEQEYLADYLKDKELFVFRKQNNIDLKNAFIELQTLKPNFNKFSNLKHNNFINIIKSLK